MSPWDRALELTHRVESSWEGCEGHGERVAQLLEKLGASLATNLELGSRDLDGLCLAARIHSLGIQVRREEDSREWEPGHWQRNKLEPGASGQQPQHPIPGREREDAGLVARFLGALLEEEEKLATSQSTTRATLRPYTKSMSIAQALLARLGKRQAEVLELDPGLRDLLHGHMEELRALGAEGQPACGPDEAGAEASLTEAHIDKLLALYEVADGWVHLTCEGMGGLSPAEAFPELCAALTNRLPAHPTSMALAFLRAQI